MTSIGVLDVDLCGPSVPKILGVEGKSVHQASEGWVPVYVDDTRRLCVMSIAFLVEVLIVFRINIRKFLRYRDQFDFCMFVSSFCPSPLPCST